MHQDIAHSEFLPGDRIIIVGRLPERGRSGVVVSRATLPAHAYVVHLDQQRNEALFFADEMSWEAPSFTRSSRRGAAAPRASRLSR